MNPLFRRVSRSSVFTLDFFHSRLGSARGGDMGGAAPAAVAAASSRPLFFPAALDVFDGDGFILKVQGVFTRIRSGLP
jgi:thiamine pyrophosphate-dependent acetolactate synthase large subunit-like protein